MPETNTTPAPGATPVPATLTIPHPTKPNVMIPLRAFHQIDGFGSSGMRLMYSSHLGKEKTRPHINEFFGDDVPESEMKGAMKTFESIDWDIATNPVHDAVDRRMLNDGEAAFNVNKSQVEVDAMLKAGIIKDTGKRCQMGMYSKQHWICRINIPVFVPPKN